MKIKQIKARQILDALGRPTVEVDLILADGTFSRASVPSGTSTGSHEAVEKRDKNSKIFDGQSVVGAVDNINCDISQYLIGREIDSQTQIDQLLIDFDGTENKSKLGANAILGVSLAFCKATAQSEKIPLFSYLAQLADSNPAIPLPMILMIEGGKHGNFATDIQEFMIVPNGNRFSNFTAILDAATKIFLTLGGILDKNNYSVGLGFEGGFCPREITSNEEALQLLLEAIKQAGFEPAQDFMLALDFASSEFYQDGEYILQSENSKAYSPKDWTNKIVTWCKNYPLFSLEDVHQEDLWQDWSHLTSQLGSTHQIVGDDLVTTNIKRIKQAEKEKAINAVLIKLNQIGTVTETLEAISLTKKFGWTPIISHRSGETADDFIADLAVGTSTPQCKFGGLNRGERIAKYNQLLRIEGQLKD